MQSCLKCETLPELISGTKTLYLWAPLGHTRAKIAQLACAQDKCRTENQAIIVELTEEEFSAFLKEAKTALTGSETADTNCLIKSKDAPLTIDDFGALQNLRQIIALYSESWLQGIFEQNRLRSAFQPIVFGKDPVIPFAHECLLRFTSDGEVVPPGPLFQSAYEADMLFQLDRAAREAHIRNAALQDHVEGKFFINFTPTSIYDPKNCLNSTFKMIRDVAMDPSRIVFEVIETERVDDLSHLKNVLETYQKEGFEVALDDLGAGHSTLTMLGDLRPNYVKLDMELVRNVDQDSFKQDMLCWIIKLAHDHGIKVIAEGIETKAESDWLIAHDADYLQGFYHARPMDRAVVRLA